jgi:mevalonate kinase
MVPLSFLAGAALGDVALGDTTSCHSAGKRWDVRLELVRSTLPVGAGLGSSAALAVAAASALLECRAQLLGAPSRTPDSGPQLLGGLPRTLDGSETVPLQLVNEWALAAETLFHGTPSGLDNTVASHGGLLRFTKVPLRIEPIRAAREGFASVGLEGFATVGLEVIIVNTHVPKSTRELVAAVRRRREASPGVIEPVFASMSAVADAAIAALTVPRADDDAVVMGLSDLVIANHGLLNALGVGHPSLDCVVAAARTAKLPAKLTGAGGGGCAFAVIPPGTDEARVAEFVERCTTGGGPGSDLPRCTCVRTRVGQAGARIEWARLQFYQ